MDSNSGDNKKLWRKVEVCSLGYYALSSRAEYVKTVISSKELADDPNFWINGGSEYSTDFTKIEDKVFMQESKENKKKKIDLPPGHYVHAQSDYPLPERLEIINIRDDAFLNINTNLKDVVSDIKAFLDSKKIYNELGMSYRRGYLFYGAPGNGKTAQIRDLSRNMFGNAIVIWLSKLPTVEMCLALSDSPLLKVFIIEEISSRNENSHYMRSILNFFDGESSTSNTIVIGTTNYPHELEKNLIDRPSRFDVIVEVPNPTPSEAREYFEKFLGRPLGKDEVDIKNLSVAYIKEIVLQHRIFGKPLKECVKNIESHKKKIKDAFPEKEKKTMGLSGADTEDSRDFLVGEYKKILGI